jgi:hypothetical protein
VTTTGTFHLAPNGPGGTVFYHWVHTDSNGTVAGQVYTIVVAAGDATTHSVATDSWNAPASPGSVQLVFTTPSYSVTAQSFDCRP